MENGLKVHKTGGRETMWHIDKVMKKIFITYMQKVTILNIRRALTNQQKNGKMQKKYNWTINEKIFKLTKNNYKF